VENNIDGHAEELVQKLLIPVRKNMKTNFTVFFKYTKRKKRTK